MKSTEKTITEALAAGRKSLDEYESKKILAAYGIPTAREIPAADPAEAVAAADRIGFPVALKICAPGAAHKTEQGLLELGINDAVALQEAGAFSIVLEKIPSAAAKKVTEAVQIPTVGIGAGPHCDGQILVTHDMLGLFEKFRPRFVRIYAELGREMREACARYVEDIKTGSFPDKSESY